MVNQQQLHTRQLKTSNKPPETSYNTTCTRVKNTQAKQYCVQFLVIFFFLTIIISLTLSPQSFTSPHILLLKTYSIKTRSPLPLPLPYTALHFTSFNFNTSKRATGGVATIQTTRLHFVSLCHNSYMDMFTWKIMAKESHSYSFL